MAFSGAFVRVVLFDLDRGGDSVPALVHFDRNGFAYVLDRRNGEFLLARWDEPWSYAGS